MTQFYSILLTTQLISLGVMLSASVSKFFIKQFILKKNPAQMADWFSSCPSFSSKKLVWMLFYSFFFNICHLCSLMSTITQIRWKLESARGMICTLRIYEPTLKHLTHVDINPNSSKNPIEERKCQRNHLSSQNLGINIGTPHSCRK